MVEKERDVAKLTRERALASPKVIEAERALKMGATQVFRDPEAAMQVFRPMLGQPREAADAMADRVLDRPESIAALKGATGFMAGRAAKAERAAAIKATVKLRPLIRDYQGMFRALEREAQGEEIDRAQRLRTGIPALSPVAASLLNPLENAARQSSDSLIRALDKARNEEPAAMEQIEGFETALRARLGPLPRFLAGRDDFAPGEFAKADRTLLAAEIPRLRQVQKVRKSLEESRRLEQSRQIGLELRR